EAARSPRVDAGVGGARGQPSQVAPGLPDNIRIPAYEVYRADLQASYEVDLFGRLGDAARAAAADTEAEAALYESVLLGVHADIAQNYFLLRQADAELAVERATLATRAEAVALFERRVAAGDLSELDLARNRAELATAQATVIALERQRAGIFNALALLTGRAPAAFELAAGALPQTLPAIPPLLPSTLLERRPDVAAAERRVMAATARIGVARAAFYPVLNLTARYGGEASELGDLLDSSNRVWALGPLAGALLAAPLFDGGRNQAALDDALAALDAAAASYREQVLTAFREVEDALVGIATLTRQAAAIDTARNAAESAYAVARARHEAGQTAYLDVLDARRTLAAARRDAATVAGERALATVALVRALGGGWQAAPGADLAVTP
ncbi:MAG: efflux transporter outer membrane subunit, partial [Gammaproteobacteria bacterium]